MDFIFTKFQKVIELDNLDKQLNLWFFGDVHRDAEACDADRWKYFLKKARKDDPDNTYYMGLGDYHDFASYSEQKAIKNSSLHDQTIEKFNRVVMDDIDFFCDEIKQMRGRLLGLVEGNHTWQFLDNTTATQVMAEKMETNYLGWLTHFTLTLEWKGKMQNIYIVACHGRAGGKRIGTSINQVEDMKAIFPAADIYIMGHNHDRGAWPVDVLIPSRGKKGISIKQKRQFLCRSGSFLKAYEAGKSGYVTSRLLRPADLGALKIRVGLHRDRKDGSDRLITDIEAVV